jgi:hypothetical protein
MRDVMWSLARSKVVPKTLADDVIALYISLEPSPHVLKGTEVSALEWAISVAEDCARMYNVDWVYTANIPF